MNATDHIPPARMRDAGRRALAVLMPVLLAACATPSAPLLPDDGQPAPVAAAKPMRTLPSHILREWGTFGVDPARKATPRARATARAKVQVNPAPVASPDILRIMAIETCLQCEQKPFHHIVTQASAAHGVPTALIHAVIQQESSYNPRATSPRKARGLMQLMPATARMLGVEDAAALYDPHTNIHAGTAYLRMLMASHDTMEEVLAAYNAGPGNVRRYNGVPPFNETRDYIRAVRHNFRLSSAD